MGVGRKEKASHRGDVSAALIVTVITAGAGTGAGAVLVTAAATAVIADEDLLRTKSSSNCFPCQGQRSGSSPLGRKKAGQRRQGE